MTIIAVKIERNEITEKAIASINSNFNRKEAGLFHGETFWRDNTAYLCIEALFPAVWVWGFIGLITLWVVDFFRWYLVMIDCLLFIPLLFSFPFLYKLLIKVSLRKAGYKGLIENIY